MVERKQFKTRLCAQYQKGRCSRPDCSFAHGNAELRRFSSSYRGTRDYPGSDLRDKLGRRHSPLQGRDARGWNALRDGSSMPLNRPDDRKQRKRHHADGQRDFSGSFRVSDGREEQVRKGNFTPSTSRDVSEEQIKKVLSDITMADDHLHRVLDRMDEKMQETEILTSRIKELESQLYAENEECKRITTKIKKFVKAHNHYTRAQDELKRSNARLQKISDELGLDISRNGVNEEDSSVNIMSDGETTGHQLKGTTPSKRRLCIDQPVAEESKQTAILTKGHPEEANGLTRFSRWNIHPQSAYGNRIEAVENRTYGPRAMEIGSKHKRGRAHTNSVSPAHKLLRGLEPGVIVLSTSMVAHAVDEEVDTELEDKIEARETASRRNRREPKNESIDLPLPPPPPLPLHLPPPPIHPTHHLQGSGKNATIEEVGEESVHVDIV